MTQNNDNQVPTIEADEGNDAIELSQVRHILEQIEKKCGKGKGRKLLTGILKKGLFTDLFSTPADTINLVSRTRFRRALLLDGAGPFLLDLHVPIEENVLSTILPGGAASFTELDERNWSAIDMNLVADAAMDVDGVVDRDGYNVVEQLTGGVKSDISGGYKGLIAESADIWSHCGLRTAWGMEQNWEMLPGAFREWAKGKTLVFLCTQVRVRQGASGLQVPILNCTGCPAVKPFSHWWSLREMWKKHMVAVRNPWGVFGPE